eukprot:m.202634 g.202634  ORF g.202634 m.202634 type:complete len:193 (-) comp17722_c5_seq2:165-743(-)
MATTRALAGPARPRAQSETLTFQMLTKMSLPDMQTVLADARDMMEKDGYSICWKAIQEADCVPKAVSEIIKAVRGNANEQSIVAIIYRAARRHEGETLSGVMMADSVCERLKHIRPALVTIIDPTLLARRMSLPPVVKENYVKARTKASAAEILIAFVELQVRQEEFSTLELLSDHLRLRGREDLAEALANI